MVRTAKPRPGGVFQLGQVEELIWIEQIVQ